MGLVLEMNEWSNELCDTLQSISLNAVNVFRWQEALMVFPRTNKQNQKKKRKVETPSPQVHTHTSHTYKHVTCAHASQVHTHDIRVNNVFFVNGAWRHQKMSLFKKWCPDTKPLQMYCKQYIFLEQTAYKRVTFSFKQHFCMMLNVIHDDWFEVLMKRCWDGFVLSGLVCSSLTFCPVFCQATALLTGRCSQQNMNGFIVSLKKVSGQSERSAKIVSTCSGCFWGKYNWLELSNI